MNFWLKNKKNNLLIILLIIIFLLSFYSYAFSSAFRKGFPTPDFTLENMDGETFNLKDYKEQQKLFILYFYSQDSKESLKGIDELTKYFAEHIIQEKYEIFLVNVPEKLEEDIALIKEFWLNEKIEFNILLDEDGEISKLYQIETLPTAIFLDKNLIVKRVYPGLISRQQTIMFQYINYLLDCREKESPAKKEKKEEECEGPCEPPPGW